LGRAIAIFIFLSINVGILATWLYAVQGGSYRDEASMMSMGILACLVSFIAQLTIATRSATLVTSEREGDTWTTLIAGPISGGEIVTGKVFGAIAGFWHLLVPFALCWFLAAFIAPYEAMFRAASMLVVCLLLAFVNANVGFFFSLRSKSTTAATVKTIIAVLFLAGGYLIPLSLFLWGGRQQIVALSEVFLIYFPAFARWGDGREFEQEMWSTFLVGMILYVMAATILHVHNRAFFDRAVGRLTATFRPETPKNAARGPLTGGAKTEDK
jgi:ABC-type transport system involved in multi-copper enzyme maturation permease subunit